MFNTITIEVGNSTKFSYVVNCNGDLFYKPFEWGLFLLLLISSVIITAATFYSKAWSYFGYGIEINYWVVAVVNVLFVIGAVMVILEVQFLPYVISSVGSVVGMFGVAVCAS